MRKLRLVAVASIGLLALGACGSQQGAAMFVGDQRVTEATLDGYVDGEIDAYLEQGATLADISYGDSRTQAAAIVLVAELGRAIGLEAPDTHGAANELEAQLIEAGKYYDELTEAAEPRELTETEDDVLMATVMPDQNLLQRVVEEWATSEGLTQEEFTEFTMAAQSDPTVIEEVVRAWGEQQAGLADDLNGYIAEYDVSVNPRYGAIDISPLIGVFKVEVPQR
ncbi:hypothetical protein [Glycomyces niveus]|uniref:hypothetical protein n=1 Tax=Glycomyces niveus TaxID=2820287 RepID=UPI001FBBB4A3|nr:hypothetical protein [Glycomyces sp. NEAU-S30]